MTTMEFLNDTVARLRKVFDEPIRVYHIDPDDFDQQVCLIALEARNTNPDEQIARLEINRRIVDWLLENATMCIRTTHRHIDPVYESPETYVIHKYRHEAIQALLRSSLSKREMDAIDAICGINDNVPVGDIAGYMRELGYIQDGREVAPICKEALDHARQALTGVHFITIH